uniref:Uncharacterized protein n=1 Tax=Opuntia streptacantha TaxID=393608 RepID=A0A7C9AW49_OPUST
MSASPVSSIFSALLSVLVTTAGQTTAFAATTGNPSRQLQPPATAAGLLPFLCHCPVLPLHIVATCWPVHRSGIVGWSSTDTVSLPPPISGSSFSHPRNAQS